MKNFKELNIDNFACNPFSKIGKEWMLITAGNTNKINTMTASWGSLGVMWGKNVAFTFIRPQRYTKTFVDSEEYFSLCFFDEFYKKTLSYLGSTSGKNEDKISKSELTPYFIDNVPCFEEANLILICKKLYVQELKPDCFLDLNLDNKWYELKDYHSMYVSEIEKIYEKNYTSI